MKNFLALVVIGLGVILSVIGFFLSAAKSVSKFGLPITLGVLAIVVLLALAIVWAFSVLLGSDGGKPE